MKTAAEASRLFFTSTYRLGRDFAIAGRASDLAFGLAARVLGASEIRAPGTARDGAVPDRSSNDHLRFIIASRLHGPAPEKTK